MRLFLNYHSNIQKQNTVCKIAKLSMFNLCKTECTEESRTLVVLMVDALPILTV